MRFDPDVVVVGYNRQIRDLAPKRETGLRAKIAFINADAARFHEQLCYPAALLGNMERETGGRFYPITEFHPKRFARQADIERYFNLKYGNRRDLGNRGYASGDGYRYRGAGEIQCTGRRNFTIFSERAEVRDAIARYAVEHPEYSGFTLVEQPECALIPEVSYLIAAIGCMEGLFTGLGFVECLSDKQEPRNYERGRAAVNGTDHKLEVAANCRKFEGILREALVA